MLVNKLGVDVLLLMFVVFRLPVCIIWTCAVCHSLDMRSMS